MYVYIYIHNIYIYIYIYIYIIILDCGDCLDIEELTCAIIMNFTLYFV